MFQKDLLASITVNLHVRVAINGCIALLQTARLHVGPSNVPVII